MPLLDDIRLRLQPFLLQWRLLLLRRSAGTLMVYTLVVSPQRIALDTTSIAAKLGDNEATGHLEDGSHAK